MSECANRQGDTLDDSLFKPAATTYVLEMTEADARDSGLPVIGHVERDPRLRIGGDGIEPIDLVVNDLANAWRSPLVQGGGR